MASEKVYRCEHCRASIREDRCRLMQIPDGPNHVRITMGIGFRLTPICMAHPGTEMVLVEATERV